jgi:hypothetical protein
VAAVSVMTGAAAASPMKKNASAPRVRRQNEVKRFILDYQPGVLL